MAIQVPLPFSSFFSKLATWTDQLRADKGVVVCTLSVAIIFILVAGVYVRPSFPFFPENLVGGSRFYEELANNPWGSGSWLAHRFLLPAISNFVGLTGSGLTYFNYFVVFIIICLVFLTFQARYSDSLIPLAATASIAFSMPVLYSLYDLWTLDGGRVLFVMLMMMARRRAWLFWSLFCLSLFNHEGNVFMAPFFLVLQWVEHENKKWVVFSSILGIALSLAIYLPIQDMTGASNGVDYSLSLVFEAPLANVKAGAWSLYDAAFSSYKLFWVVIFFGIYVQWRDRKYLGAFLIFSAPASAMLQLVFGGPEVFRYMMVAFPALLLSIDAIAERYDHKVVGQVLLHLAVLNFIVPQQLVWGIQVGKMQSLFHMLTFWVLGSK